MTKRFASNIKKARAKVTPEVIAEYIEQLSLTLVGVPLTHIWNFDETNLTDDPGSKKVICIRDYEYPERVCNTSKSATSLMMCGSASGDSMPPYVVYKAKAMWSSCVGGGPEGARYNRSASGWFDQQSFEDWFVTLALPVLRKLEGKKVLIGDSLSSHFTPRVLELCEQHDILFVALPPNSTHLTQPFFRLMKAIWRNLL